MLKIENIKLAPGGGMSALTAETARILKVREKDLQSMRLLRRSRYTGEQRCRKADRTGTGTFQE